MTMTIITRYLFRLCYNNIKSINFDPFQLLYIHINGVTINYNSNKRIRLYIIYIPKYYIIITIVIVYVQRTQSVWYRKTYCRRSGNIYALAGAGVREPVGYAFKSKCNRLIFVRLTGG